MAASISLVGAPIKADGNVFRIFKTIYETAMINRTLIVGINRFQQPRLIFVSLKKIVSDFFLSIFERKKNHFFSWEKIKRKSPFDLLYDLYFSDESYEN